MITWLLALACAPAPALDVSLPEGPVRGALAPVVTARATGDAPAPSMDALDWVALVDGAPVALPLDTTALTDGPHVLRCYALGGRWRDDGPATELDFVVDNSPPVVSVARRSRAVTQGAVLPIFLALDEPGEIALEILGAERPLYRIDGPEAGGRWRALVGISLRQTPGPLSAVVRIQDALGNAGVVRFDVEVVEVEWPTGGQIRGVSMKNSSEAVERMRAERDGAYAAILPEQSWAGGMLWPTEGRVSSPYGKYRTYPDGSRSHHDAVDITNRPGTPVHAANGGEVLVARRQAILGNAVILGHGQGVTTSYNHLARIDVAEGDRVERGDRVGLMGNTGRSTGPHLHWGMVVDSVAVDASVWPEDGFAEPGPLEPVSP